MKSTATAPVVVSNKVDANQLLLSWFSAKLISHWWCSNIYIDAVAAVIHTTLRAHNLLSIIIHSVYVRSFVHSCSQACASNSFAKFISTNIFSEEEEKSKNDDTRKVGIGPRKEKPYAKWINKGDLVKHLAVWNTLDSRTRTYVQHL